MSTATNPPPNGDRGGATYDPTHDRIRLGRQASDVWAAMVGGRVHTLKSLETATGHPQPSISARLRDFRKPEFGGHTVERYRSGEGRGLFLYVLKVNRGKGGW